MGWKKGKQRPREGLEPGQGITGRALEDRPAGLGGAVPKVARAELASFPVWITVADTWEPERWCGEWAQGPVSRHTEMHRHASDLNGTVTLVAATSTEQPDASLP